ncbi:MAG TPA: YdcF family protein, partial [Bacteroidia bacterium]|nr:YdcF family protein [Bacteroidia bacterium]
MFFALSKILEFLLTPFTWIVALLVLSLWLKKPVWKKRLAISSLILLIFFSNPYLANKVINWWEMDPYPLTSIDSPYDV